jgi:putative transposase
VPLKKGNHCVYDCHYHFVFTVKYRRAVLEGHVVAELVRISGEIEERYEIVMQCLGADKNHVPLLCSAHPKLGPGQIARL